MAQRYDQKYVIGFEADTRQLQAQLREVSQSLAKLGANNGMADYNIEIREAMESASKLNSYLRSAMNVDTGRVDLNKFNRAIKAGGDDLKYLANNLVSLGPEGIRTFQNMASAIAESEIPLKRTSKLMDSLWVTMKNTMRWQITSSALNTFIGGLQTAYNYAKDLNESLNNIRIVSGKSMKEMAEFAKQANDAAKSLSTTTTNYTNASLIYFQQGKVRFF